MNRLAVGMPVSMALYSKPGEVITGKIRKLPYPYGGGGTNVEDEDKSTRISVDASPVEAGFEMGDLISVEVILQNKEDVLWIPPQAIRVFEGRRFVVIQDGDLQRRVDVRIGVEGEGRVEIIEGLEEAPASNVENAPVVARCTLKTKLNPRILIYRLMVAGNGFDLEGREEIWDCTTCSTCTSRCPKQVDPMAMLVALRSAVIEKGRCKS